MLSNDLFMQIEAIKVRKHTILWWFNFTDTHTHRSSHNVCTKENYLALGQKCSRIQKPKTKNHISFLSSVWKRANFVVWWSRKGKSKTNLMSIVNANLSANTQCVCVWLWVWVSLKNSWRGQPCQTTNLAKTSRVVIKRSSRGCQPAAVVVVVLSHFRRSSLYCTCK